jgi:hydrogenase expression/formation protein HypD
VKYISEFRDGAIARTVAAAIAETADPARHYRVMEFCGGHTHTISRYGIEDLLPPNVQLIHGPGCPVCVLPIGRLDMAIALARRPEVTLCVYGDMMRVPASGRASLMSAKAEGADIRMVWSSADALAIARAEPARQVVFFAIGFETTTPATAVALSRAKAEGLGNFTVFCNHVLTPSAISAILALAQEPGGVAIDGFVGPGHVSTVIGSRPYEHFAESYGKPIVIAGFEPLDILQSVLMLVEQLNAGRAAVETQYSRAVSRDGNAKAQALIAETLALRDGFEWRGLGTIPDSALRVADAYAEFDAETRFGLAYRSVPDHPACECATILRGAKRPQDCRIFGTGCTPENPIGSCMVSPEGACAAHYLYGRFREAAE